MTNTYYRIRGALVVPVLLLVLVRSEVCSAAPEKNPYLAAAQQLFDSLEYEQALETLQPAKSWASNTPQDVARIALLEGMLQAELRHEAASLGAFKRALAINPDIVLPAMTSPKVESLFRQARQEMTGKSKKSSKTAPNAGPPPTSTPPSTAAVSSSEVPSIAPAPTLARTSPASSEVPWPSSLRSKSWIPAAVAGACVVSGGILYASSASTHRRLSQGDSDIQQPAQLQQALQTGVNQQRGAFALLGLGAAGAATAVVMYLLGAETGPRVSLTPTPGGAQASVLVRLP